MNSVLCGLDLRQKFSVSGSVLGLGFWLVIWCWFFVWLGFFQIRIVNQKNVNFENFLLSFFCDCIPELSPLAFYCISAIICDWCF